MKVLITGGAGFIGSHLAEKLLDNGHSVTIIDNLSTGSVKNIEHLKGSIKFKYFFGSVLNKKLMLKLVKNVDIIFHLAAAVGVELIVSDPVGTIETNIRGTDIILDLVQKKKIRVVIISTSEVYGKSKNKKFKEGDDLILGATIKSRWCYAASKIIDEFLGLAYNKKKKVSVVILRLFNVVGPRQIGRYGMVVPRFVKQALENKPITIYGSGKQTRTFLHVNDAVDAIAKIAFNNKAYGEVFNVGGTKETPILSLAVRINKVLNSHSRIKFVSYDKAYEKGFEDMMRRVPDISKIKKFIDWHPQFSLNDMIKSAAEDIKKSKPMKKCL